MSLDDFGTGYSSLVHLRRLPVSELKIDRSFVARLAVDNEDAEIVRCTVDLAHSLGLLVVAEGVEDDETWERLRDLGCDAVQGWLVAAAMPPEETTAWLRARGAGLAAPAAAAHAGRRGAALRRGRGAASTAPSAGRADAPPVRRRTGGADVGPAVARSRPARPCGHRGAPRQTVSRAPARRPIGLGPNHTHSPQRIAACLASRARRSPTSPGWRVWS